VSRADIRANLKHARAYLVQENAKWPGELRAVRSEDWPAQHLDARDRVVGMFRSRTHLVQVYEAQPPALVRLSIQRCALNDYGGWVDGIDWETLQRLKSEAGYGEYDAVEVYPTDGDVVNVANLRHLFVMREQLPFTWRKKK
jgi:hypothetical protein